MDEGREKGGTSRGRGRPRSYTESAKKRRKKEADMKYREKNKKVSVTAEAADAIRAIGDEKKMTDKEVVSLLLSAYNEGQGSTSQMTRGISTPRTSQQSFQESPAVCDKVEGTCTPTSTNRFPFFSSPLVPSMKRRTVTQNIPESKSDSTSTCISGIEEMSDSQTPQRVRRSSDPDDMSEVFPEGEEEQDSSCEATEKGDFIFPQEEILEEENEDDVWHPSYYHERYTAYRARNLLAMIDYQEHKDRPFAVDKDGKQKLRSRWSKHAAIWVVFRVRVPKAYNYMSGLMERILERRLQDDRPMYRPPEPLPSDPRAIRQSLAPYPPPPMEELLERRKSRFN